MVDTSPTADVTGFAVDSIRINNGSSDLIKLGPQGKSSTQPRLPTSGEGGPLVIQGPAFLQ